jgi:hypothetical protein
MKKPTFYEVTLRRDVQQVVRVRVEATSREGAIETAESISDSTLAWRVEEFIGTHRPEVHRVSTAHNSCNKVTPT